MIDDDDFIGSRNRGRARPFGSSRRPGNGPAEGLVDGLAGLIGGGLFDRVMSDVSSWFEEERVGNGARRGRPFDPDASPGTSSDRPTGSAREAGPDGMAREDVDTRDASTAAEQPPETSGDYADEHVIDSQRGRGPKGYRRSDKRLTELVSDALLDAFDLDAREMTVSSKDGEIRLSGTVPTRRQKHRAENLAARAASVQDVENRLRVKTVGASRAGRGRGAGGGAGEQAGDQAGEQAGGTPGKSTRDADEHGHPD